MHSTSKNKKIYSDNFVALIFMYVHVIYHKLSGLENKKIQTVFKLEGIRVV
jgi:hypothetical protein